MGSSFSVITTAFDHIQDWWQGLTIYLAIVPLTSLHISAMALATLSETVTTTSIVSALATATLPSYTRPSSRI